MCCEINIIQMMYLSQTFFSYKRLFTCSGAVNFVKGVIGTGISLLSFLNPVEAQVANIDLSTSYQIIRGYGGINNPGWIADLTPAQGNLAFGNGPGQIGMSILRVRIAYDETQFYKEIPTAVLAKNNGAIIFATPWTPPASLKSNSNIVGGSLNAASYASYATHLKNFCTYMSTNGAPLYAISVQNEPDITVTYESCSWSSAQMIDFISNNTITTGNTKLIAAESYQFIHGLTDPILNSAVAEPKVSIVAGHLYGTSVSNYPYPLALSKGKEIWMTEHYYDASDANTVWLPVGQEIHDCMSASYSAYVWWYIRRSYGMIDESSNVTKRGYVMSQYSKFIRPGSVRVSVPANPATGLSVTSYTNGNNIIVVAVNNNTSAKSQDFKILHGNPVSAFTQYTTSASKNVNNDGNISVTANAFTATFDAQSVTTLVGTQIALPVDLISFTAKPQANDVALNWATASEQDNDHFEILHSTDGNSFSVIGSVKGSGTSNAIHQYGFIHENPGQGKHYYQLRQVDQSGIFKLSSIEAVDLENGVQPSLLFPNPFDERLTLLTDGSWTNAEVKIYNVLGEVFYQNKLTIGSLELSTENYPSGIYFIHIQSDTRSEILKVVK